MPLNLFLFGYPRLEHQGQPLPIKLRKGLALLAYLAMAGSPLGRDRLAELLWPESPAGDGRACLRRTLHRMQQRLGAGVFLATPDTIALAPQVVASDAVTFGTLLEQSRREVDPQASRALLRQAVALYRDDFLAGFGLPECPDFEDWQVQQSEGLRQAFGETLTHLAHAAAAADDREAALAHAHRRLSLDPLHEPTHQLLMRLHAESGEPAAALRRYEECRDMLMRELGVEPQASTERIRHAIAHGDYPLALVPMSTPTPVRYVVSDGVHVAYRLYGEGPLTLVALPGFVSHLDFYWDQPELAGFMQALGRLARVVCFDKRGMGLSDRVDQAATPQHTAEDLLRILDAERIDQAVLLGVSEGGPAALTLAAAAPARVKALILYGTLARAMRADDYPWGYAAESYDAQVRALIDDWGGPAGIERFAPGWAGDVERRAWWARALRLAASPGTVRQVFEALKSMDVRPLLAGIACPTLVLHRRDDLAVPIGHGRYLAEHIARARWIELPGEDHWWWVGDAGLVLHHLATFLHSLRDT
ncbi:alpha/beta fold hydrolase [Halomonas sp. C05BenzN]|uniref:alpha/beta fold hydrolase n=1 Tax=Halomonas sp. C05BenzN TaxID=3411041 RepID=UPI003B9524DD